MAYVCAIHATVNRGNHVPAIDQNFSRLVWQYRQQPFFTIGNEAET